MTEDVANLERIVVEDAIDWLVLLQSGEATETDLRGFRLWHDGDSSHRAAWENLQSKLAPFQTVAKMGLPKGELSRRYAKRRSSRRAVVVKGLALFLVAASGTEAANRFVPLDDLVAGFRTDTGERKSFTLSDGSQVTLNARSAADTLSGTAARGVRLIDGEILVRAVADPARPFVVRSDSAQISFAGGGVQVQLRQGVLSAISLDTAVTFRAPNGDSLRLDPGQGGVFESDTLRRSDPVDVADATAWTNGWLIVHDQPLSVIVSAIRPYSPGLISISGKAARLRMSGVFHLDAPQRTLLALAETMPLKIQRIGSLFVRIDC